MADYRCYPIGPFGAITGPAQIIDCDDASALVHAREMLATEKYEVWQGAQSLSVQRAADHLLVSRSRRARRHAHRWSR